MASVVLAVVGIAQYDDYGYLEKKVKKEIDALTDKLREIITSEDRGVSSLGALFAQNNRIKHRVLKADWDNNGKAAGFLRNEQVVSAAHRLVVFYDGKCPFTKDIIDRALAARKILKIVRVEPTQLSYKLPERSDE